MSAPRKFDWDEARRLRKAGLSYAEIGRRLGVSDTAVIRVLVPSVKARMDAAASAFAMTGTCHVCGKKRVARYGFRGEAPRCSECAMREASTTVRPTSLRCVTCKKWRPDKAFPRSRATSSFRRGRHRECTECNTRAKREWRARRRRQAA